nr:autotransporter outer membrane beta-barrel domain-containing protein [Rahnella rivi]
MTRPLVLGDATTQTGTLSIDSTSVLLAGGQSAADIAGFGGANDVTVTNAGTLDLTDSAGSTHDRLTIHGNYVGDNGVLKLQTVLNGDDSASDRLVISGGQASGSTQIQVTNVGGTGVATAGSGIMLVEATNGATTTASAFTLAGGSVSAGAYDYLLFRGSSDDAQSWYLRNSLIVVTPPVPPPR